jgi:hypothetical protein
MIHSGRAWLSGLVSCHTVLRLGMTIDSDELVKALQENLKLRRHLATEVAGANGEKLAAVRYRSTRIFGALRHAFSGRVRQASMSTAVVELMTLDGAREQYATQLRQLDRQALLKEIEQLRRLLTDLPPPTQ